MSARNFLKLTVPNNLEYLPVIQATVRKMAEKFGFRDDALYEIEVGVEEAVSGVIENAFEPGESGEFDIICERVPMGMRLVIKDKGLPFDPHHLPEYVPPETLDEVSGRGLSVFLLKKNMDRVSFRKGMR